jgi:hypothetical protein
VAASHLRKLSGEDWWSRTASSSPPKTSRHPPTNQKRTNTIRAPGLYIRGLFNMGNCLNRWFTLILQISLILITQIVIRNQWNQNLWNHCNPKNQRFRQLEFGIFNGIFVSWTKTNKISAYRSLPELSCLFWIWRQNYGLQETCTALLFLLKISFIWQNIREIAESLLA